MAAAPVAVFGANTPLLWDHPSPPDGSGRPYWKVVSGRLTAEPTQFLIADLDAARAAGMRIIRADIGVSRSWPSPTAAPDPGAVYNRRVTVVLRLLAERDMRLMLMAHQSPDWMRPGTGSNPRQFPTDLAAWRRWWEWAVRIWPQVLIWQVWNEPNTKEFTSIPDDRKSERPGRYVPVQKAAAAGIRAADPHAVIGGIAASKTDDGFIRACYELGAKDDFDVLTYQPYQGRADQPPEAVDFAGIERKERVMNTPAVLAVMAEYGDADKPVMWTEFGFSDHPNDADTPVWRRGVPDEATAADYLRRMYELPRVHGWHQVRALIGFVFWTSQTDPYGHIPNFRYLNADGTQQPRLAVLADYHRANPHRDLLGAAMLGDKPPADDYVDAELIRAGHVMAATAVHGCGSADPLAEPVTVQAPELPGVQTLVAPDGGTAWDTYNQRWVTWKPAGPVVDWWRFADERPEVALYGVVGDTDHWAKEFAGDHTSRSTHGVNVGGVRIYPKAGWEYAIDLGFGDLAAEFDRWLLAECQASRAGEVKYWNSRGWHYHRDRNWVPTESGDQHVHLSGMPGWEYKRSDLLARFWAFHTGQETDMPLTAADAALVAEAVWTKKIATSTLDNGAPHSAHEVVPNAIATARAVKSGFAADATRDAAHQATLTGLLDIVNKLAAAEDVDVQAELAKLAARVDAAAEQTRAAVLAQATAAAERDGVLMAAVADLSEQIAGIEAGEPADPERLKAALADVLSRITVEPEAA